MIMTSYLSIALISLSATLLRLPISGPFYCVPMLVLCLSSSVPSRPHGSSFRPSLPMPLAHTCLFFCGTYFQLLYDAWFVEVSWRKSPNGPCYHQGKFMIFEGPQCGLDSFLYFHSLGHSFRVRYRLQPHSLFSHSLQTIL